MNAGIDPTVQGLLGLLQLGRRVRGATDLAAFGFVAVNETRTVLSYRQAALWLDGEASRVAALSGIAQVDPGAPFVQWLSRLFRAVTPVPAPRAVDPAALPPLIAEEWGNWLPAQLLCVPLPHQGGGPQGLLLLAREQAWREEEVALSGEVGVLLGHALYALRPRGSAWRRAWTKLRNRKLLLRIAVAVLVLALLPVRLSALAQAEVAPVDPFVVRAPLEGVIDSLQVRPNQAVAKGAPLFNLDDTTLRGRYAAAQKAYEAAQEAFRQIAQQAVTDDKSKLEMAESRADLRQKAVDLAFTGDQLARVKVKAEREGVAVFSDANDWTGKAVAIGEKVLVLADPAKVELTAYLPVGDQLKLAPGASVAFYPKAAPFSSYDATVESVAYKAVPTNEGVLAYRIKARFTDASTPPRLGLMGTARLYGHRVPLIYAILRRPLSALRQWL